MVNRHRGEIEAVFDGKPMRLCLTLGALAELESAFGDEDMLALAERFSAGRLSARHAIKIIGAGLRGAGADVTDEAIAHMRVRGGAAGFVGIVAELLRATFGDDAAGPDDVQSAGLQPAKQAHCGSGEVAVGARVPFPGTTSCTSVSAC